jgi:hypothetical protein
MDSGKAHPLPGLTPMMKAGPREQIIAFPGKELKLY